MIDFWNVQYNSSDQVYTIYFKNAIFKAIRIAKSVEKPAIRIWLQIYLSCQNCGQVTL